MIFHRSYSSIVTSVRQNRLLASWMDAHTKNGDRLLPDLAEVTAVASYEPSELMIYDVVMDGALPRFKVIQEGASLVASFGFSGLGRFLDEVIDPRLWSLTQPIYLECVEQRLPVYSTFSVCDSLGQKVLYERLLLPFGKHCVTQLAALLKTTSWGGAFLNKDLMRPDLNDPEYITRAVIIPRH